MCFNESYKALMLVWGCTKQTVWGENTEPIKLPTLNSSCIKAETAEALSVDFHFSGLAGTMERTLHSGLTCPIAQRHLVIGTDQSCAAGTDHVPNLPLIFSSSRFLLHALFSLHSSSLLNTPSQFSPLSLMFSCLANPSQAYLISHIRFTFPSHPPSSKLILISF